MPASFSAPPVFRLAAFLLIVIQAAREDLTRMEARRWPLLSLMIFLVLFPAGDPNYALRAIESAAGCGAGLLSFSSARFFSRGKIGLADVWTAGCVGALGGLRFFSSASLAAILLMIPARRGRAHPFIPALLAGTIFAALPSVFRAYRVFPPNR